MRATYRSTAALLLFIFALLPLSQRVSAQQVADAGKSFSVEDWAGGVWRSARRGDSDALAAALERFSQPTDDPSFNSIQKSIDRLKSHITLREEERAKRIAELSTELDKVLADQVSDISLNKALKPAVEYQMLATDRVAALQEPRIVQLIQKTEKAAKDAEARGDWMSASELFYRLHALTEEIGTFKADADRLTQRLAMLRLYVPQRLWELRNQRQIASGEDPLPPYNAFGDGYKEKLATINEVLVARVLQFVPRHIDQVPTGQVLAAGLRAVKTMVTTTDLSAEFKELADKVKVDAMTTFLDSEAAKIANVKAVDLLRVDDLLTRLKDTNNETVGIPFEAVLHEFGNGMMSRLDEFSAIIWPDEVKRFQRQTQGKLVGIGVSIEFDDQSRVKVVSPLEGTPAHRAGIHAGDIIKKVNGKATFGMSLDQAVELITGPANTQVTITVEREVDAAEEQPAAIAPADSNDSDTKVIRKKNKVEIDKIITRAVIPITTVKGWKRNGARENDWDWFIDKQHGIGYVRLSQFTDTTAPDFDRAVRQMQSDGLNGLILDLRFNPGGLLEQAVEIVQRFVDVDRGYVVMMAGPNNSVQSPEYTKPSKARLAKTPVVVLINENSASASEIVSGALRHYGARGGRDDGPAIKSLVLGERSYGKGSVQNVWPLGSNAMMKLTIQHYMLPNKQIIHRKPGAADWGVDPNLRVESLPKQTNEALRLRRDADVFKIDENGRLDNAGGKTPNVDDLIEKGIDVQLETALVLLQSQMIAQGAEHARLNK